MKANVSPFSINKSEIIAQTQDKKDRNNKKWEGVEVKEKLTRASLVSEF